MKRYTFSQLQRFLECPRKYFYEYVLGKKPVYDGVQLPVGIATHTGVECLYWGGTRQEALGKAEEAFWRELPPALYATLSDKEKLKAGNGLEVVREVVAKYPWRAEEGEKVLFQEEIVTVDMGSDREYSGRIDRIIGVNGGLWVHDTKTTGSKLPGFVKVLRMSRQFAGYSLLAEKLTGKTVLGVISDVIVKPSCYNRKDGKVTLSGTDFHREPMHFEGGFVNWFHKTAGLIEHAEEETAFVMNTGSCAKWNRICPFFEVCRFGDRGTNMLEGPKFESWQGELEEEEG